MNLPEGLAWRRARPGGAEWLDALPRLAADCADQWDLRERICGWAIVHAVAWGGETGTDWDPAMVACAGWLADA